MLDGMRQTKGRRKPAVAVFHCVLLLCKHRAVLTAVHSLTYSLPLLGEPCFPGVSERLHYGGRGVKECPVGQEKVLVELVVH